MSDSNNSLALCYGSASAAKSSDIGPFGVLPHHLVELRRSGLSDATIRAAGISSETKYLRLASLLGWSKVSKRMSPAIVFPFRAADGSIGYCRIKPDTPRVLGGKQIKYESPRGQPNQIYLPPGVALLLDDPTGELLITEGEKKALAATQEGFPCLGLVGVYGWKDGKREQLLPGLEHIVWRHRRTFIAFDSDAAKNANIRDAEARLAKHLIDRGAIVRVVRLPEGPLDANGKPTKVGLDDFLVAHGSGALRRMIDTEATEPDPLSPLEMKQLAQSLDPAAEAGAILNAEAVEGMPVLRFWRSTWLLWKHGSYVEVPAAEVRARVIRALNTRYSKLSQRVTGDVLDQMKAQSVIWGTREPPAWIGKDSPLGWGATEMLATRNALVHLPSLVGGADHTIPPTPKFFTTTALDYDFLPAADRPSGWLEFLSQLWRDDPQSIGTLQEWFGYMLVLDTSLQKMLVLIGPPRSGKGTIARVLRAMIGTMNVAGPSLASFAHQFGLWPLIGKSLAVIHDARLGNRSDQAIILERLLSITGEDALTIDRKLIELWTGNLPTRLMLLSNELPRLVDASGALVSRMILLRLTESFIGREDPELTASLLSELPGILLWSIEGWRRLRERGRFEQPPTGAELVNNIADLASPIGQFVRECCVLGAGYHVAVADIFQRWRNWCSSRLQESCTAGVFGRDLRAAVPLLRHHQPRLADGRRGSVYEGIRLID